MGIEFKNVFLICIDHHDDMNYVVGRSFSMKKAQRLAKEAEKYWPNKEIYLTVEKIPVNNPLKNLLTSDEEDIVETKNKNPKDICICGKNPGGCIGSLSCKCSAIARCKRVTEENPLDFENYSYQKKPNLEPAFVQIMDVKRGIVAATIPEWDPDEIISLAFNEIPSNLRKMLKPGLQLVADVNLTAASITDLVLDNLRYEESDESDYETLEEIDNEEEVEELAESGESPSETIEEPVDDIAPEDPSNNETKNI